MAASIKKIVSKSQHQESKPDLSGPGIHYPIIGGVYGSISRNRRIIYTTYQACVRKYPGPMFLMMDPAAWISRISMMILVLQNGDVVRLTDNDQADGIFLELFFLRYPATDPESLG